jgi:Fe-S oxidoreductase
LLKENGIKMEPKGLEVTYHDPCKVGRYEGVYDYKPGRYERIYDKPREALRLCGIKVNELPQNKEIAPCCGAGAVVRPVYRDLSLKLATKVLDQVPVSPLVTSCPFCEFQFQWAARKAGSSKKIAYITDVILQAIS